MIDNIKSMIVSKNPAGFPVPDFIHPKDGSVRALWRFSQDDVLHVSFSVTGTELSANTGVDSYLASECATAVIDQAAGEAQERGYFPK